MSTWYGQHMPPTLSNRNPTSIWPVFLFFGADKKMWALTSKHEVAAATFKRWWNNTDVWFSNRAQCLHIFTSSASSATSCYPRPKPIPRVACHTVSQAICPIDSQVQQKEESINWHCWCVLFLSDMLNTKLDFEMSPHRIEALVIILQNDSVVSLLKRPLQKCLLLMTSQLFTCMEKMRRPTRAWTLNPQVTLQ